MLSIDPVVVTADAVDELKTYVRIESEEEDPLIVALLSAAIRHGEDFTGQIFLRRAATDRLPVSSAWQRLGVTPVVSITGVTGLPLDGLAFPLPVSAYAIDIDGAGDGWVRVTEPGAANRVDVSLIAGVAADWPTLPETLRHGVIRLAAHLHGVRDAADDGGPPAIVAALWRPWRRMRLS